MALIETKLEAIEKTVAKLDAKVDMLVQKPAKKWDSLISNITQILTAAVMAVILAKIGLM